MGCFYPMGTILLRIRKFATGTPILCKFICIRFDFMFLCFECTCNQKGELSHLRNIPAIDSLSQLTLDQDELANLNNHSWFCRNCIGNSFPFDHFTDDDEFIHDINQFYENEQISLMHLQSLKTKSK